MSNGETTRKRELILGEVGNKEEQPYVNRFITFYTLRFLWKFNNNRMPELHHLLFAKGRVEDGRSIYNKMLKQDTYVRESRAKECEEITGINYRYFTGEQGITVYGLPMKTWWRFIELWNARNSDKERNEFAVLEGEIHEKLRKAGGGDLSHQQPAFRNMAHFARSKCKRTAKNIENELEDIEKIIQGLRKEELEIVDNRKLESYRIALKEHLERVTAIHVLNGWKSR